MSRAAHLRALRCCRDLSPYRYYYMSLTDLLEYVWDWEAWHGKTSGAIGWERKILGAQAEGLE